MTFQGGNIVSLIKILSFKKKGLIFPENRHESLTKKRKRAAKARDLDNLITLFANEDGF